MEVRKRTNAETSDEPMNKIQRDGKENVKKVEDKENLVFEDPFGDDVIEEEVHHATDEETKEMEVEDKKEKNVWRPGVDTLAEGEVLDYDESAYDLYYAMTAQWPSLSIDIIRDNLGNCRKRFPMTVQVVAGTQASSPEDNEVAIMKMSELHRARPRSDSDSESDDEVDGDPILESRSIKHRGGVNRIRSMPQHSSVVATWADTGKVHLWDISKQLDSLNGKNAAGISNNPPPISTFGGHADEGYAMDWSPVQQGHLLTGDCKKYIYMWNPATQGGASWSVDKVPFSGHKDSVEDLQWSPTEATVFASCSVDQTVRIWDTRKKSGSMLHVHAHDQDVNVISWNRNVAYLLVSGSDDGSFKIWDLRKFKSDNPVAHFRYHTAPVTSVEWHPSDESVLAVSGADNQISIWDMSVEEDMEAKANVAPQKVDVPPQLLFVHQGQTDIKELRFHPQCPGVVVSTAGDGFNVFKPANIS